MSEMSFPRENHGDAGIAAGGDDIAVTDGPARLDDGANPRAARKLNGIRHRKESIARKVGSFGAEPGFPASNFHRIHT